MPKMKKLNLPKKGAGRKLAARLKELGKQNPPKDLVTKITGGEAGQKKTPPLRGLRIR